MYFIVPFWSAGLGKGFTGTGDFADAVYSFDFYMFRGYNAEIWMYDYANREGRWYRIDFVNNDKHKPYSAEIG